MFTSCAKASLPMQFDHQLVDYIGARVEDV